MKDLFSKLFRTFELRDLCSYWVVLAIMTGVGLLAFFVEGTGVFGNTLAGTAGLASLAGILVLFATDSDGTGDDDDEEDEAAKTIIAMPVWMVEKAQKDAADISDPAEGDMPADVGIEEPTDEVDLGTAQTMMFDPADAVAAATAIKEQTSDSVASKTASTEDSIPAGDPVPEPEELPEAGTGTVQFAAAVQSAKTPPTEAGDDQEEAVTSAQTIAYSPEEMEKLRGTLGQAIAQQGSPEPQESPEVEEAEEEEEEEALKTMMYMPAMDATPSEPQAAPVEEPQEEEALKTMMYMPAADAAAQEPEPEPEPEQAKDDPTTEALAPTMAFMPAVDGEEQALQTMAFDPNMKQKVQDATQAAEDNPDVETGGQTQMYSLEDGDKLKEAYAMLQQKEGEEQPPAPQDVPQVKVEPKPEPEPEPAPESKPRRDTVSASGIDYDVDVKSGMGAGTAIVLFVVLLAAAGAATAVILHYFGVVELPFNLPTME